VVQPTALSLFGRNSAKKGNETSALTPQKKGREIQGINLDLVANRTYALNETATKNVTEIVSDIDEECLLLDNTEKETILSQRTETTKPKEKNKSALRGWLSSFASFVIVISIGTMASLWELTLPTTYSESLLIRPTPQLSMMDEDTAPEEPAVVDDDDEAPIDQVDNETPKPRERQVTTRRIDSQRALAVSYVKEAVQKVSPSVLRIDTETHLRDNDKSSSPGWLQEGQGSGVIFSADGLILTNAHVVDDTTKVTVTLSDGRVFQAVVTGSDEVTDIAVLKILPEGEALPDFPVGDFGDSDDLEVGQFVVALGSPGGLDMTATMGIVSGLRRSSADVGLSHKKVDYIQTDAALNPGNSGGPLVDVESGRIIGINACIRSNMEGTSFSIPINKVQEILPDLAAGRPIHHSYIGASMADCTPNWARQLNRNNEKRLQVPEVHGALVSKVHSNSPAANGGLQMNDVIVDIGGTKVVSSDDASRSIDRAPVGKDLILTVIRGGYPVNIRVRPIDLATRLKEMRAERQRGHSRQPRKLLQELLPLQNQPS
jgi:S1-C subfamily serine protease